MLSVTNGQDLKIPELQVGDFVYLPDPSSLVTISLTDVYGISDTSTIIYAEGDLVIPSAKMPLPATRSFTYYTLTVTFEAGGVSLVSSLSLRVQKFIPLFSTAQSVRMLLGASDQELPDEEIDLFDSYIELSKQLDGIDLFADEDLTRSANDLIVTHEALKQLDSLPLKLLLTTQIDDHKKTRFSTAKIADIKTNLEAKYWALRNIFSAEQSVPELDLVTFAVRTDPFSGA